MKIKIGDNSLKLRAGASTDNIDRGPRGYSAYEVAVQNGYTGTEEEWLLSLKGPKGDTGLKGERGLQGPRGQQGIQGEPGPSNSLSIGNVTKGEVPSASITGESPNQVLNLTLPKGDKGDEGPRGLQGTQGPQGPKGEQGPKGDTGESGVWTKKETPPAGYKVWITPDGEAGTIPTKVSELENDAHYVTEEDVEDFTSIYVGKREDAPESSKIVIEETNTPNSLGDASGTTIGITDSADAEVVNYKQYGITKQETTEGKNLIGTNYITGVTLNDATTNDITIRNNWASTIVSNENLLKVLKPSTTYTISYKYKVLERPSEFGSDNKHGYILGLYDGSSNLIFFGETQKNTIALNTWDTITKTFTTPASLTNYKMIAYDFRDANNTTAGAIEVSELQIEKGSTATEYEPYTGGQPSPSPDYPQEIEVGRGKNLFDEKQLLETTGWSINSDGYYTGSAQDLKTKYGPTTDGFTKGIKFKNNTQYTITCDFYASVNNGNNRFHFEYTDGTNSDVSWNDTTSTKKIVTSTLGKTIKKICFNCNNNARIIYLKNIQLEKGLVATSYLPYNTIEVKSTGINMFNAKAIKEKLINVNEDGSQITMPVVTSGNGIYSTGCYLKELAPNLKVGDVVTLYATNNSANVYNTYIYLDAPASMLWNFGTTKTITENMLNSPVSLYGNRFQNGETEQITISDFRMVLGTENKPFEPYKESSITYNLGDNFLADKDYIENGVLNKNVRHLRLAIADMNNNDNYPGWKNVPYIGKDYPNQNDKLSNSCNYKSNITNTYVALNSLGGGSNLILFKTLFGGLTQTEIKEQYPDLILDLYYEMPQTEQIPLETTGELRTFEPNTIITNDLDSEMEVEYKGNKDLEFYIKSGNHFLKWLG